MSNSETAVVMTSGQIVYEAFWKSLIQTEPYKDWEYLQKDAQTAWEVAARAGAVSHTKSNGGQAFPCEHHYDVKGMSLRDYFASQALSDIAGQVPLHGQSVMMADLFARLSYVLADAMLGARKVGESTPEVNGLPRDGD